MTGYQEVLTDPSYKGQIIVFTYPLIGNYGINEKDFESKKPQVKAAVVYEACDHFSHHEAVYSLKEYLQKWNIPLLTHVDTRAVVKKSGQTERWVRLSQPLKKPLRSPFSQRTWQNRHPHRKSAHSATDINISPSSISAIKVNRIITCQTRPQGHRGAISANGSCIRHEAGRHCAIERTWRPESHSAVFRKDQKHHQPLSDSWHLSRPSADCARVRREYIQPPFGHRVQIIRSSTVKRNASS